MYILYEIKTGKIWGTSNVPWKDGSYKTDILAKKQVKDRQVTYNNDTGEITETLTDFEDEADVGATLKNIITEISDLKIQLSEQASKLATLEGELKILK